MVDILFEMKSSDFKRGTLSKLAVGNERNFLECNLRECTYGIANAVIRTFILACANFSFVRPATSGHTQGSVELSFKRFIKLTRLIGRVHYSVGIPARSEYEEIRSYGKLRNSALDPNDVNPPYFSQMNMTNEIIRSIMDFLEKDLKLHLKTQEFSLEFEF